ncbi:MAG: T9SS type A sorting domain-containing protein [Ignavibacteriota bacterium]
MNLQVLLKLNNYIITLIIFCCVVLNAQNSNANYKLAETNEVLIDTSDFFPLQDGNMWSFAASTIYGLEYLNVKVIKDTLLPNGHVYKYISDYFGESYYRKDSNKIYQYYGDSAACSEREFKYLDFTANDSAFWGICRDLASCGNARGISSTYYDYTYYTYLNKPLETKHFQDVLLNANDTIWTPCDGSEYWFSKAIGISRIFIFNVGDFWLQGAIINGQQFGTLVSVENESLPVPSGYELLQNYPNPFNPSTIINYAVKEAGLVKIKVFDILGSEVAELVNETKEAGTFSVEFNAANLPSGVYIYTMQVNKFSSSQKMLLLK